MRCCCILRLSVSEGSVFGVPGILPGRLHVGESFFPSIDCMIILGGCIFCSDPVCSLEWLVGIHVAHVGGHCYSPL